MKKLRKEEEEKVTEAKEKEENPGKPDKVKKVDSEALKYELEIAEKTQAEQDKKEKRAAELFNKMNKE